MASMSPVERNILVAYFWTGNKRLSFLVNFLMEFDTDRLHRIISRPVLLLLLLPNRADVSLL
jgi:hypothetical protein